MPTDGSFAVRRLKAPTTLFHEPCFINVVRLGEQTEAYLLSKRHILQEIVLPMISAPHQDIVAKSGSCLDRMDLAAW